MSFTAQILLPSKPPPSRRGTRAQSLGNTALPLNRACIVEPLVQVSTRRTWREPLQYVGEAGTADDKDTKESESTIDKIVALGKFDAMHEGHRRLALTASTMGRPYLVSFYGMAAVLGWEERQPIVAPVDRPRILHLWGAKNAQGLVPQQRYLPFDQVRSMSPREFVEFLVYDLKANGVVVGRNYRFGHRASGTTDDLLTFGKELGLKVQIVDLLLSENNHNGSACPHEMHPAPVSSSRVRDNLAAGNMDTVAELLGRRHRLIATVIGRGASLIIVRQSVTSFPLPPPMWGRWVGWGGAVDSGVYELSSSPCVVARRWGRRDLQEHRRRTLSTS